MGDGEALPPARGPRLEEHRAVLRRREDRGRGAAAEIPPLMRDPVDPRGVRQHPGRPVGGNRVRRDAPPQLVADLHIFIGPVVALVMVHDLEPERAVLRARIAGHDVPPDPAAGQVVEAGERPHGEERVLARDRDRRRDAEMPGGRPHHADERDRIVRRPADPVPDGDIGRVLVEVVNGGHVGEEQAVEAPALHCPRKVLPVLHRAEALDLPVLGVGPAERHVVDGRVHHEAQQVHLARRHRTGPSGAYPPGVP